MQTALSYNHKDYIVKSLINTGFVMSPSVYNSLYNMHPSDAIIFQISTSRKHL